MKTRTLILTLFTSISILLITNGLAFAEPITGCLKHSSGKIYNAQIGTEPTNSCSFLDDQITWSEEGPQGDQGPPGEDGTDGQDGTIIHQVHLEDDNDSACGSFSFPNINDPTTFGWCPNSNPLLPDPTTDRFAFIIQDDMITANSVVIANLGNRSPGSCTARFTNPVLRTFPLLCEGPPGDGVSLNYAIINP